MTTKNKSNKKCPFCKKQNDVTAVNCIHCGTTLNSEIQDVHIKPETIVEKALFQDYEILEIIGKGGMATVYKALHKRLNRIVALKVIHQNLVHDEDFVSRFIKEAQICASLNHRNIITVHDVGIIGTVYFIAMEYLEGFDLYTLIRSRGNLEVDEALRLTIPIAEALSYIHQLGYVHRDVKTSNIFVTNEGRPVLMDFGIVHSNNGKTLSTSSEILGTPEYMSPEQASGSAEMDHRSDIYSLGVILYESLTGIMPFKGENFITVLHQVIHDKPVTPIELNKKIPRWLNDVVISCLEKNRDQRMANAQNLVASLCQQQLFKKKAKNKSEKLLLISIAVTIVIITSLIIFYLFTSNIKSDYQNSTLSAKKDSSQKYVSVLKIQKPLAPPSKENPNKGNLLESRPKQPEVAQDKGIKQENPAEKSESIGSRETQKKVVEPSNISSAEDQKIASQDKPNSGFRLSSSQLNSAENYGIELVLVESEVQGKNDFYIARTETAQKSWKMLMSNNPSENEGDNLPVENVKVNEIQAFINNLSNKTGIRFRLPSIQEWQYAAKGGKFTRGYLYSGSSKIDDVAWYVNNSDETKSVGRKDKNELGILDMSGNVWEICNGSRKCGGSYFSPPNLCTVSSSQAANITFDTGFRLVVSD